MGDKYDINVGKGKFKMAHYTLSFDTSANSVSIALLDGQEVLAESDQWMERGQGEALIPMIIALLEKAKTTMSEVKQIAVSIGPGSFTGVRVGLAAARGMGLALHIPVYGVTTLEAATYQTTGCVLSIFNTKRGDYYTQLFNNGQPVEEPTIRTLSDIQALTFDNLAGPVDDEVATATHKSYLNNQPPLAINVGKMAEIIHREANPLYLREADVTC